MTPIPGAPRRGMVLAAGRGLRMRPITDTLPKPLIPIGGRSMLDRALDSLVAVGVDEVIINVHHLAALIERHLAARATPRLHISHERVLLETGGGIAQALSWLGDEAFFVVNGDVLWQDGNEPSLITLAKGWRDERMDALLLLHPVATALGYSGAGDFDQADGRLIRRKTGAAAPYLYAGLQILHPRLFRDAPQGAFSLNWLYDQAAARGRLFGAIHQGGWCHVGTPADIPLAEAFLAGEPATGGR